MTGRAAHEELEQLLAMVAHDLRTPIGTIQITAEKWERAGDRKDLRRDAALIVRSAKRIERLLRDLLEAAHADSGSLRVEVATIDVVPVLRQAFEAAAGVAGRRALRLEMPESPVLAVCDAERVLQVLDNLLGNALKFTRDDGGVVVRLERTDDEIRIAIEDDGPGIDASRLPGLFDRRWERRERDEREGWGLGLPIAKALVVAQGGRIWVESARGSGSRFAFALRAPPGE